MTERIMRALEAVRLHADAAAVVLCETVPSSETAFVVAVTPEGFVPTSTPFPLNGYTEPLLESDPSRISLLLPVTLRLALPAPASHAWTQPLPGTQLKVILAWSHAPNPDVVQALDSFIDAELCLPAVDFALRQQLRLENTHLQTVLGLLEQAVVTIDNLRQEATVNRAGMHLLGLASGTVPARLISEALHRFQAAALNQEQVAEVASKLVREPSATVTGVVWHFADTPTYIRVTTAALDSSGVSGRIWVFDDISVQMEALEAAEQARRQYRLLAEHADDIVFRESPDRTFEWVSDSVTASLGWSPQEMMGRSPFEFVHPDDRDRVLAIGSASGDKKTAKERHVYRARYLRKDGVYRWLEVSIRTIFDASGVIQARVGSCRDVHERVEAQQALTLTQARLRASLDGMLDPQVLVAPVRDDSGAIVDFVYLEANRATTQYLSMSAESLIGKTMLETMPGIKDSGLLALYVKAMESDAPLVLDDVLYNNEVLGLVRRHDIRGTRVGDELTLTWRDTTERHETQAKIAESEQHFRLLAENSADVVALAREGLIDWVSPSVTRTLGWQPEQWLGHSYLEFVHPEDQELAKEAMSSILAAGALVLRLRVLALSGQSHWVEAHGSVYVGAQGTQEGVVVSFRTIDAEVAAEAAIARLARFDALTGLANRNEALNRFAERQSQARRPGGGTAVLFCDVDRFKAINDTYGHAAGDEALRALADRIRACVRSNDICARMGGDELLVILDGIHALEDARQIAEKLRQAAERTIPVGQAEVHASLSIGVALVQSGEEFDQVMARADTAMYEAKKNGRNKVVLVQ